MLSEEAENRVVERLVNRIEQGNTYVLQRIGDTLNKIGKLDYTRAYELSQVLKYGGDYDKIVKELAKITDMNVKDIYEIFDEVAKSDYEFAKQFYDYRGMKYIPYDQNIALQNQIKAIAGMTAQTYINLSNTSSIGFGFVDETTGQSTFKGLQQAYYDAIDEAVMSVSQGKETYEQAVKRTINQLGGSGLKTIYDSTYVDENGVVRNRSRRLDSAVRMNIKTGMRDLHNQTQEIFGKEFGADGVEVSVHDNPAIDHADVQGKQFSTQSKNGQPSEWEKLNTIGYAYDYKGRLIDIRHISKKGHTSFRPISTLNCYHKAFSVILGISEPEYSDEQLEEINEENEKGFELDGKHYTNYEGTQLQRRLETAIRQQKDIQIMAKNSNKMDMVDKAQKKITQLNAKYKELASVSGLPTNKNRLRVSGYKRTNVKNINKKERTIEEWNKHFENKYGTIDWINNVEGRLFVSKSLDKMDNKLLNNTLKHVEYLYDKYNLNKDGLRIIYDDIYGEQGAFALARGKNGIGLTSKMLDKNNLIESVKDNIEHKYFMKVNKGNEELYPITHEIGHIVEHKIIDKNNIVERSAKDNEIKELLISNVRKRTDLSENEIKKLYISDYGRSRKSFEWFAETFTQYELGEKNIWIEEFEKWLKQQNF